MQLIQLERGEWNFFCPVTGQSVFNDIGEPNATTIKGTWNDDVSDEPQILCEELKTQWDSYAAGQEEADDDVDVAAFLKSLDKSHWVAFEIISIGNACGPISSTIWTVLDLA